MCGRYVSPDTAAIEAQWQVGRGRGTAFPMRFNVAPATDVPILYADEGGLALAAARWGLIPQWWKQAKPPRYCHNARIEDAAARPMWRDALRRARCLVPALGWYEWRDSDKQPYFFYRGDGRLAALAGLMSAWRDPASGAPRMTCAILTAQAGAGLAPVHDRMPVALAPGAEQAWLEAGALEPSDAGIALHPVRRLVNSSRAEGAELIEPAA